MRKMYINPPATRRRNNGQSPSCFYYACLGTERHMMNTIRNNYKYERKLGGQDLLESRVTVLYLMLANPILTIRKPSEL